jgi:tryptophan synthase alpha subunit
MTDPINTHTGLGAIAAMFAGAQKEHRAAFLPFFTVGYPTYDESIDILAAMAEEGVDGFEIGLPFSDPLADGPTIQAASQIALDHGIRVADGFRAVRDLRARGVRQPILLFSYLNPLLTYGPDQVVTEAKAAGAQGFIIPDLPPDEKHLFAACEREAMALVFFVAPTSHPDRIALVAEHATGFIYVISVTGTTGARDALPQDLTDFIGRVRAVTDKPLVLGFGISSPEQVQAVSKLVNGFIVASALIRARQNGDAAAVRQLVRSLRHAVAVAR